MGGNWDMGMGGHGNTVGGNQCVYTQSFSEEIMFSKVHMNSLVTERNGIFMIIVNFKNASNPLLLFEVEVRNRRTQIQSVCLFKINTVLELRDKFVLVIVQKQVPYVDQCKPLSMLVVANVFQCHTFQENLVNITFIF